MTNVQNHRTEVLEQIAARISELDGLSRDVADEALAQDIDRVSGLLKVLLVLISDLPNAFDPGTAWWAEWSAKQRATIGRIPPQCRT